MDVQIAFGIEIFRNIIFLCHTSGIADSNFCTFPHHIAKRPGVFHCALSRHYQYFHGHQDATDGCPCKSVDNADCVLVNLFVRTELLNAQIVFQCLCCESNFFAVTVNNFFRRLAAQRTDSSLQFTDTGFSCVSVNNRIQNFVWDTALRSFQSMLFQLLFDKMLFGNMKFFFTGITAQFDDFHTIQQRRRNRIQ